MTVSASVGQGSHTRVRGKGTLTARPTEALGFYVSGLIGAADSSETPSRYLRQRVAEAGVVGALPLRRETDGYRAIWLVSGLSAGVADARSGGTLVQGCAPFDSSCTRTPYVLSARVQTASAHVGFAGENADGAHFGAGLRVRRLAISDLSRDRSALSTEPFIAWMAEPYTEVRYPLAFGSFDVSVVGTSRLGDPLPGGEQLYEAEMMAVHAGLSVDLGRALRLVR